MTNEVPNNSDLEPMKHDRAFMDYLKSIPFYIKNIELTRMLLDDDDSSIHMRWGAIPRDKPFSTIISSNTHEPMVLAKVFANMDAVIAVEIVLTGSEDIAEAHEAVKIYLHDILDMNDVEDVVKQAMDTLVIQHLFKPEQPSKKE